MGFQPYVMLKEDDARHYRYHKFANMIYDVTICLQSNPSSLQDFALRNYLRHQAHKLILHQNSLYQIYKSSRGWVNYAYEMRL